MERRRRRADPLGAELLVCESSERWLLLRPLEASESGEEAIQKGSPWRPALSLSVRRRQNPAEEAGWSGFFFFVYWMLHQRRKHQAERPQPNGTEGLWD